MMNAINKMLKIENRNAVAFDKDRYLERVRMSYDYVIRRFSRGNVNVQLGNQHSTSSLAALKKAGHKAIKELQKDL